jgi:hypothetical protein
MLFNVYIWCAIQFQSKYVFIAKCYFVFIKMVYVFKLVTENCF